MTSGARLRIDGGAAKGVCRQRDTSPSSTMRTRNRRLVVHGREPSALMKSRRRIASPRELRTTLTVTYGQAITTGISTLPEWGSEVTLHSSNLDPSMSAEGSLAAAARSSWDVCFTPESCRGCRRPARQLRATNGHLKLCTQSRLAEIDQIGAAQRKSA